MKRMMTFGLAGIVSMVVACSGDEEASSDAPAPGEGATTTAQANASGAPAAPDAPSAPTEKSECLAHADCGALGASTFCGHPACIAGHCIIQSSQAAGTPLPSQLYGDCHERRCAANGTVVDAIDDKDAYASPNECIESKCTNGVLSMIPRTQGTLCAYGICTQDARCVQCIPGVQACTIAGQLCIDGACAGPLCQNGVKDPGEGDVDCGGACPKCVAGKNCTSPLQCASGVCTAGKCAAPTCNDGKLNGLETESDCGGSECPACPTDARCNAPSDCQSQVCIEGVCYPPSCTDAVKNGDELGVDCGGSCAPCN